MSARKPGPIAKAVRRVVLGKPEDRRTPGPTDQEIRDLTERENGR